MVNTAGSLALVGLLSAAAPAWSADEHVRSSDPLVLASIEDGKARSTTFSGLVARLTASDVVVYVEPRLRLPAGLVGYLDHRVTATGDRRYLWIVVDAMLEHDRLIAIIAHELQHAVEVAGVPDARSAAAIDGVFRSRTCVRPPTNCGETEAALRVQETVSAELRKR